MLKVLSPTNVSETGFQVNWYIENPFGFQSISVQVATDEDMTNSVSYVHIDDVTADHLLLENLHGATPYYYKISLLNNGSAIVESAVKSAETSFAMKSIDLITEDGISLSGKLAYLESLPGKRPGIVFMHELGVWVNPWIGSALFRQLVSDGYICLTFFFRGHGTSTPVDDLMDLVNDKNLVAEDLHSALNQSTTWQGNWIFVMSQRWIFLLKPKYFTM